MWLRHYVLAPEAETCNIFWILKGPFMGVRGEANVGRTVDDPE